LRRRPSRSLRSRSHDSLKMSPNPKVWAMLRFQTSLRRDYTADTRAKAAFSSGRKCARFGSKLDHSYPASFAYSRHSLQHLVLIGQFFYECIIWRSGPFCLTRFKRLNERRCPSGEPWGVMLMGYLMRTRGGFFQVYMLRERERGAFRCWIGAIL
jgi:hypothetical protein